ncbi:MAG: hypothetical protein WC982_14170 [Advenella sp.]
MSDKSKPAFPVPYTVQNMYGDQVTEHTDGMTLREYYAGLAMQVMVASHNDYEPRWAVAFADALIAELQREDSHE